MIDISPEKVIHIILRSREYDAKVASWDDSKDPRDAEDETDSVLEDFGDDEIRSELGDYIDTLNIDEQESLVALTWIGRGTYSAKSYDEALKTARREHINETKDYLLGIPLLSDYLEEGLSQMGYGVEQLEEDLIRREPDWPS